MDRIPMLDSSTVIEVEAINLRAPKLEAEAPGPHSFENETQEPVLKMEGRNLRTELEGRSRCVNICGRLGLPCSDR